MRITDVVVNRFSMGPLENPFHNSNSRSLFSEKGFAFIEVHTDEGVTGIAPTYASQVMRPSNIARLKPLIVGEDPMNSSRLWSKMYPAPDVGAIGAIDNALWDLRGKILGQPVYRLLGGVRDRVPVYASGGYYHEGKTLDHLAKEYAGFVAAGYLAVKLKVGGLPLREDVARVATVRDAIGADIGLAVDANRAWDLPQATKFVRAVEEFDLAWVEEPLAVADFVGAAQLRQRIDIPVAGGEGGQGRWEFRDLIDQGAIDIVQPDCENCGGLTEWMRIAAYASARYLKVSPHGTHLTAAHAVAATDNATTVEGLEELFPWRREVIEHWPVVNGELCLPQTPGLGIILDEAAMARGTKF
ncbi:MAG TPA: mandelate racemase/muconate lactonizing enzyme family protein [Acidimicrobiales bacterium]